MSLISNKYEQWGQFKRARNLNTNLPDKDPSFITMKDREKLVDDLFDYILRMERNESNSIRRNNR